jgi:putative two-component system response regulator
MMDQIEQQIQKKKQKILVVDDCQLNRELLISILEDRYELEEASGGIQAVTTLRQRASEFSLLLLDLNMPEVNGFDVLAYMNRYHWIDELPVIVISAETSSSYIERAYDLGATDFIRRPFDATLVRCRVRNTLLLSARQRGLMTIVDEQIREKKRDNELVISILSHIVESHNSESGPHTQHIGMITDLLLHRLVQKTHRYGLSLNDISLIVMASALHDIGKIAIPNEIINKPGPLTPEEFEIMKGHTLAGVRMLDSLPDYQQAEPLVQVTYEICRWHHERYDGSGYPDGLKGDEIPISAQAVSLADVYDALTSKRCYKDAYSHETAMEMIFGGQCGAFNPLLLECLEELEDEIRQAMEEDETQPVPAHEMDKVAVRLQASGLSASDHLLQRLDLERQQFQFLYETAQEPLFWYTVSPSLININEACQHMFGLEGTIYDPKQDKKFLQVLGESPLRAVLEQVYRTSPDSPEVVVDLHLKADGEVRLYRCICRTIWAPGNDRHYTGVVGRLVDVDRQLRIKIADGRINVRRAKDLVQNGLCVMNGLEAQLAMEYLGLVFDSVRLVDVDNCRVVDPECTSRCQRGRCFDCWKKTDRCENCTSATCLATKHRTSKLEYVDDKIYRAQSMYVEVDGKPYVLEMVNQVANENMLEGYSRESIIAAIGAHNKTLYTDPVTSVYNRRYYEDKLRHLSDARSVAMMDVDDFKHINDTWGHQAGDVALARIAQAIRDCVRTTDSVVRYGGDEFVVVFRGIPEEVFQRKLLEIQASVSAVHIEAYPDIRCSVSVGGCCGQGTVAELLSQADREMYRNKRNKKTRRNMI